MSMRLWIRFVLVCGAMILAVVIFHSWQGDRRDRAQLASDLAATRQTLAAAEARQHHRDVQLAETLATLATQKRIVISPAQIISDLPQRIPLPTPLVLQTAEKPAASGDKPLPDAGLRHDRANAPARAKLQAVVPPEDLKPLYDFAIDCQTCQAKLAATQGDLADEQIKTLSLTHERDEALRVARGGSVWRRVGRAAKWFVIGAAAGTVAAKFAH